MNCTIHKDLSRAKLVHVLPEPFASQVPRTLAEPITSVFFPNKVVTGRIAAKALSRVAGLHRRSQVGRISSRCHVATHGFGRDSLERRQTGGDSHQAYHSPAITRGTQNQPENA